MRIYLISDNTDTLTGMRLAGVDGMVAANADEARAAFDSAIKDADVGILLITEKLSAGLSDEIRDAKLLRELPLVVEIPDRHGSTRRPDYIENYVREAIGVKI